MGQGAGSTLGFGGLLDLKGNDKYLADRKKIRGRLVPDEWSHVQGAGLSIRSPDWTTRFSIYGGVGFLSDGAGNDLYFASDGNCMGSSYFMSIGALVDHNGSDKYISENGHGIGFAVHLSNGVLIDRAGDDHYYGKIYTGGVGSDRSVAVLADYNGNDIYGPDENYASALILKESTLQPESRSETTLRKAVQGKMVELSYGSAIKPKAIGLLIDYHGDDRYYANPAEERESVGGVVPPVEPQNWSNAILLDLGGKDYYHKSGRKDNYYFKYMDHGLCYDTEYDDGINVGILPLPYHRRLLEYSDSLGPHVRDSANFHDLNDLLNPDLYVRYAAMGRIIQEGMAAIPDLVFILASSTDSELNRDILEILNVHIISSNVKPDHFRQLEQLLKARDPFVQMFAARKLGYWRVQPARPALVQAAVDNNDSVRTSILWALGQVAAAEVPETLISAASTDPSVKCRRAAVAALSEIAKRSTKEQKSWASRLKEVLLKSLSSPDNAIRTFAAKGLRYFVQQQGVDAAMSKRLCDESVYVVRAAAKALILNGEKGAIPRLIKTLQYPSIDTFEYYDREIVKDLAFYCGVDFSGEDRYAFSTWNRWWSENGSQVNLKLNLEIMHRIEVAFKASGEQRGLAIFEKLISENPDNIVVRRRYSRFCYEWITFRLLTRKRVGAGILKRCLRLQKKQTELEPGIADHWERLAYFYARLSEFEESVAAMEKALQIQPENQGFQSAIKQYKILLERNRGTIRQKI
jgi:tetratricopeptide (TPR) repeat protein